MKVSFQILLVSFIFDSMFCVQIENEDTYTQGSDDTFYYSQLGGSIGGSFDITVGSYSYNMETIASVIKEGNTIVRVFQFESRSLSGTSYTFVFRLPLKGLYGNNHYLNRFAPGRVYFDDESADGYRINTLNPSDPIFRLGHYDPSSWIRNIDGSLTVQYRISGLDGENALEMEITFQCSYIHTHLFYNHYEYPVGRQHVNISSTTFCAVLGYPPTTQPTTAAPSMNPTAIPTSNPTAPSQTPSTTSTRRPSFIPSPKPSNMPFVVPVANVNSLSAPGNYCISLYLLNNTHFYWNSTKLEVLNVDEKPYYKLTPGCSLPYVGNDYCYSYNDSLPSHMPGSYLITRVGAFIDQNYWLIYWQAKNSTGELTFGNQLLPMVYADKPPLAATGGQVCSKVMVGACV